MIAIPDGELPKPVIEKNISNLAVNKINNSTTDLEQLGRLEDDQLYDEARHPLVRGKGPKREALAVVK